MDAAWNQLVDSMNFTLAIMRNTSTIVNKVTNGLTWLIGQANAMHSSTDKFKDGIQPEMFHRTVKEITTIKIDSGRFFGVKLFYNCLSLEIISDVKASFEGVWRWLTSPH